MIADIIKNPRKLLNFARKIRLARQLYGKPYSALLQRFAELSLNEKYTPQEVFLWELLSLPSKEAVLRHTASKKALVGLQQRLNPASAAMLTEDKGLFYRYCQALGLATPRFFAGIGPRLAWTAEGAVLLGAPQWAAFLDALTEPEIVVKPSLGAYGRGVRLLTRRDDGWCDQDGRRMTSAALVAELERDPDYNSFVVQERVRNHEDLARLGGTDFHQGVRIVTALSGRGAVEILVSNIKIIGGDAATDNFSSGAKGNFLCDVDIATGKLGAAVQGNPDAIGLREVTEHPRTGVTICGFQLPFWQESCDLVRRAAVEFLPLITVGWDVSITPSGPLLMEGNAWWDPHNAQKSMAPFRDYESAIFAKEGTRRGP